MIEDWVLTIVQDEWHATNRRGAFGILFHFHQVANFHTKRQLSAQVMAGTFHHIRCLFSALGLCGTFLDARQSNESKVLH